MPDLAERTIREAEYARSLRQPWESQWQRLADYELPSMANFTAQISPGQRRGTKIVNSTGKLAARELATRINGFLTGDGTNWFDLRIPDPRIENDPAVRAWLDQVKSVLYAVFNSPGSGFGVTKEPTYQQVVVFGNGPVYVGENAQGWPVFRAAFLGNCSIWTDEDGRPIAMFREYQNTAWGLSRQFARDRLPQPVLAALEKDPQRMFSCVHAVRPRDDQDPFDIAGKPWIETYVLKDGKVLLAEPMGYWEFPWLFSRWNVSPDEYYGRGPGEDALPDVMMLQQIDKDIFEHVSMNVKPQWLTEDESGTSVRINQLPGGMIYGRMNAQGNWNVQRLGPSGTANEAMEIRADIKRTIERLFYLDAFKMVEKVTDKGSVAHMSATEFAGRQAEQMRYAGPALERLRAEFLFPLLNRSVSILLRNHKVPPPPWQLRGAPIHPEYVSPLAMAQQGAERASALQLIGDIIPLAQISDRALDIVNWERTGKVLARGAHAPQEMLNSPAEQAAMQQSRADLAAQNASIEQMGTAATAAKDNAQALQLLQGGA